MQPIIQKQIKTKTQLFEMEIEGLYRYILSSHTKLMKVWNDVECEQTLRGLGPKALSVFTASEYIQTILKTADPSYEVIKPYKLIEVDEPVLDEEGNQKMIVTYEIVFDENTGEQKLDEDGKVITVKIETPMFHKVKKKILLTPTFNDDGSLDELIEIE